MPAESILCFGACQTRSFLEDESRLLLLRRTRDHGTSLHGALTSSREFKTFCVPGTGRTLAHIAAKRNEIRAYAKLVSRTAATPLTSLPYLASQLSCTNIPLSLMLHVCKTWRALQRAAPSNHIIHELIRDNVSRQSQENADFHLDLSNLRHHYFEESIPHCDVISVRFLSTTKQLGQQIPRIHAAAASILDSGCGTGDTALEPKVIDTKHCDRVC